jgi:hypothetical protein
MLQVGATGIGEEAEACCYNKKNKGNKNHLNIKNTLSG